MSAQHAAYLGVIFDPKVFERKLRLAKKLLEGQDFDGLLVRGTSGIVFGSVLAHRLKKRLVIVRKDNDGTHSDYRVENICKGDRLIFVDDLVASGKTINAAVAAALKETDFNISLSGAILYGERKSDTISFRNKDWVETASNIHQKILSEAQRKKQVEEEKARAREELSKSSYKPIEKTEARSIWGANGSLAFYNVSYDEIHTFKGIAYGQK